MKQNGGSGSGGGGGCCCNVSKASLSLKPSWRGFERLKRKKMEWRNRGKKFRKKWNKRNRKRGVDGHHWRKEERSPIQIGLVLSASLRWTPRWGLLTRNPIDVLVYSSRNSRIDMFYITGHRLQCLVLTRFRNRDVTPQVPTEYVHVHVNSTKNINKMNK